MKTIPDFAREILSRSPTPALPLPRLLEAIEEETAGQITNAERILPEIRTRPDLFRVLDPHDRPVASCDGQARRGPAMEPRDLGSRPRPRHRGELTGICPDRGKSSVSGKERR